MKIRRFHNFFLLLLERIYLPVKVIPEYIREFLILSWVYIKDVIEIEKSFYSSMFNVLKNLFYVSLAFPDQLFVSSSEINFVCMS